MLPTYQERRGNTITKYCDPYGRHKKAPTLLSIKVDLCSQPFRGSALRNNVCLHA